MSNNQLSVILNSKFSSSINSFGMLLVMMAIEAGMTRYTAIKEAIEALTHTLALEYAPSKITFNVMHSPLTRTNSAAGFGFPSEMMADPKAVGCKLAKLVGKTNPMLSAGFVNNVQLQMSYHLRVPMGKLMSMLSEKARQNKKESLWKTIKKRLTYNRSNIIRVNL